MNEKNHGWTNIKDKQPDRKGRYLVVRHFFTITRIDIADFTLNLNEVDKYDFPEKDGYRGVAGWYGYNEGYFEMDDITHWRELPEIPEDVDQDEED